MYKLIAAIYYHFKPAEFNVMVADEYQRRVPELLVKFGFEVATVVAIAAQEIRIAETKAERLTIEANMKDMIKEIAAKK